jgi:endonuclease III
MGGLSHLLRTFLSLQIKSIETNLTLKCIELLISTLSDILYADRDTGKELLKQNLQLLLEKKDQVVHTCIMLVDMIGDYSIVQEKTRGECFEDV